MCGIVGYIGNEDSKEILLKGLEKLEYRGYDSAGIAVKNENGVHVFKEKGRIADLRNIVDEEYSHILGLDIHAGQLMGYQVKTMHIRTKVLLVVLHSFIMGLLKTMNFKTRIFNGRYI